MLPVNEVFQTLQGEATWTGTPAIFVRLQGCDVGCPWCDTKHTWAFDGQEVSAGQMLRKQEDDPTFARLEVDHLLTILSGYQARHVVFTGGEPCAYDLGPVTRALEAEGYQVQIETSGTYEVRASDRTWVTVSPKINMPGGRAVLPRALHRAQEIKHPIGSPRDIQALMELIGDLKPAGGIWLQPLSQSEKATRLCVQAATEHGWRVSLQTHKFVGLR